MVLVSSGPYMCGGALVASKYVVTAAHCLYFNRAATQPMAASDVSVTLGEHRRDRTEDMEKQVGVTKIFRHEAYIPFRFVNDIALRELEEDVDLNIYTPVCMARTEDTDTFYGKDALAYGWGKTTYRGLTSNKLLEVSLPVITPEECWESTHDGQICAGGEGGDTCQVNLALEQKRIFNIINHYHYCFRVIAAAHSLITIKVSTYSLEQPATVTGDVARYIIAEMNYKMI